jgi:signal transduction histidine kinase
MLKKYHNEYEKSKLKVFSELFYTQSKNTYRIVENLLSWSQSQMNYVKLNLQKFELKDFVKETLIDYADLSQKKDIKIINSIPKNILVKADKNIARSVFQNLVTNAVKFSYPKSKILISTSIEKKEMKNFVSIYVTDYGIGMDSETVSNLFKIDNTSSRKGTNNELGSGLGLILCKELAEMNQGNISVESKLGIGSRFCFTLPLCSHKLNDIKLNKEPIRDSVLS